MISQVIGPWNKEMIELWAREAQPVAKSLGPHVGIAVIHNSMLCPPDALVPLGRSAKYAAEMLECLAHAIVADKSVDGRDFVESNFIRTYAGVLPLGIFYTLDDAREWGLALLKEKGF